MQFVSPQTVNTKEAMSNLFNEYAEHFQSRAVVIPASLRQVIEKVTIPMAVIAFVYETAQTGAVADARLRSCFSKGSTNRRVVINGKNLGGNPPFFFLF